MARIHKSLVNDGSTGEGKPRGSESRKAAKRAPAHRAAGAPVSSTEGHGSGVRDERDEVSPTIDTVRRSVAHVLQAVSESVQETIGRRDSVMADTRRAEERLAALEANRSMLRELGATRTQVEELTRDLEALRAERVEVLRATDRSLRSALELRETLIAEIAELQHRRDQLAFDVERASASPRVEAAPAAAPVRSVAEAPAEEVVMEPPTPMRVEPPDVPELEAPKARPSETRGTSRRRGFPLLRSAIIVVFALLVGALAILLTELPDAFGWHLLTVMSGSMEPTIPVGSVVIERQFPAEEIHEGEVITFFTPSTGPDTPVTHRVVGMETQDGQRRLVTKGDANDTEDTWTVNASQPVGRVDGWLPYLGYLRAWLSTALARAIIIGVAVLGLILPAVWPRSQGNGGEMRSSETATFDDLSRDIDALLDTNTERRAPRATE